MKQEKNICHVLGIISVLLFVAVVPFAYGAYGDHDGPYGENDGIHGGNCLSPENYPPMNPNIKGWATGVEDYWRPEGLTQGTPEIVLGQPGGTFHVLSLGDGGWIIVTFDQAIGNGPGADFAVWENGFISRQPGTKGLLWAELMFVEVSTDGENFARFPSVNLIPASPPLGGFGCIDPTYVHSVAGKYPNGNDGRDEGAAFDLDDLRSDSCVIGGQLDLTDIRYVRLIDVIGDGSTLDSFGNPMLDPWPTPFGTGGADLDAVGVLNQRRDNVPPHKPTLSSPEDNEEGVSLSPTVTTGPFSDDNAGEYHFKTRWQISKDPDGFESDPVLDVQSHASLVSLPLPGGMLELATRYYWRVKFYDSYGEGSEWSETSSFTTTPNSNDVDSDGIPDDQELELDSTVDLDEDGTYDVDQMTDQFKVLNTVVGSGQMGVKAEAGVTIKYLQSVDPEDYAGESPEGKPDNFLLGLIDFTLKVENLGDTATFTVYLSEPAPDGYQWHKYEPTKGWYLFSNATFSQDRKSVTLTLKDGGNGDFYEGEDGLIVDPGGVGSVSDTPTPSSSSAGQADFGGVGGCFIGTCF